MIHAYAAALPDTLNLSAREVVLPVVPMFHVNAWSLPYSCTMTGAKMVFPGPHLDGKSLHELFEAEGVTMSAGVPTVWLGLLTYMKEKNLRFSTLKSVVIGGSACPPAMIRAFQDDYGVQVLHAWGMTEMSPLGTAGTLKAKQAEARQGGALRAAEQAGARDLRRRSAHRRRERRRAAVGRQGVRRPAGARALGDQELLQGRGRRSRCAGGWFPTGDVVHHRPRGLHPDHRPLEGRDQVGRRVDQLDRPGEHRHRAPGDRRGRGDRRAAPEMGRAPDRGRGEEGRAGGLEGRAAAGSTKARSRSGGCPTTWCS